MEKRLLVIQEHNAKRAGLHWDIRFEDYGVLDDYLAIRIPDTTEPYGKSGEPGKVLRSFVIPKHEFPLKGKFRLVIKTEDHPWDYRYFEGTIKFGYGEGEVKLLFNDYVNVSTFTDDKITFEFKENWYTIFKTDKNYLITQKQ